MERQIPMAARKILQEEVNRWDRTALFIYKDSE